MRKLHEKSIVLGIGIGMIITSIAGMIYSAGTQKELSKAEIISLAKTYGLIEPTGFINKNASNNTMVAPEKDTSNNNETANTTASNTSNNTETANNTAANTSTTNKEADKTDTNKQQAPDNLDAERNISIAVQRGFGSKQVAKALLEKGVITSEAEFNAALDSYNATQKIRTGTYLFKKNDDLDYIVKTICKFK